MNKEIDPEILDKNRLFATLMGGKPVGNGFEFSAPPTTTDPSRLYHIEDIAYHSSWDWFIPLWSKMLDKRDLKNDDHAIEEVTVAICENDVYAAWRVISERIYAKVCPQKINGSCPLHNVHCNYPDCEKEDE